MARKCDFFKEIGNKYYCVVKQDEINDETYKEYCKYDYSNKCPIYQFYLKQKDGKI